MLMAAGKSVDYNEPSQKRRAFGVRAAAKAR
jgi:hypothetical protein